MEYVALLWFWMLHVAATMEIAKSKGRSQRGWALVAFLCGPMPIAMLTVGLMERQSVSDRENQEQELKEAMRIRKRYEELGE